MKLLLKILCWQLCWQLCSISCVSLVLSGLIGGCISIRSSIFMKLLLVNLCLLLRYIFCSCKSNRTYICMYLTYIWWIWINFRFNLSINFYSLLWNTKNRSIWYWSHPWWNILHLYRSSRYNFTPRQLYKRMIKLLKIRNFILIWSQSQLNIKTW